MSLLGERVRALIKSVWLRKHIENMEEERERRRVGGEAYNFSSRDLSVGGSKHWNHSGRSRGWGKSLTGGGAKGCV